MPTLKSRLGDWELPNVHAWSERELLIRAPEDRLIGPTTKVATIGSCFASELASMMKKVGIVGGMHPGGLFYSTATIRQEMERLAGGVDRAGRRTVLAGRMAGSWIRSATTTRSIRTRPTLRAERSAADAAADELFRDARVVVATLGLIETFRNPSTGNTYRGIPHPGRVSDPRRRIPSAHRRRHAVRPGAHPARRARQLDATLVLTTSPVPLHTTFTAHDVRVANMESKSRIRAAVSEFIDRHPDVRYFHSYEMVVTAERQSDYFREDGRHVHRHAVKYIVSEFLRLFGDPALQMPTSTRRG